MFIGVFLSFLIVTNLCQCGRAYKIATRTNTNPDLNIAGDDSSVVSKGRSFQQVMAEGKRECLKEFVWYRGRERADVDLHI